MGGVLAMPLPGSAQPPLTAGGIRELTRRASREAHGDPTALILALDRHVRDTWGDFDSFPLSLVRDERLLVTLTPPYLDYRRSLMDMLRTARPPDQAVWTGTVNLSVSPRRLDAPDIHAVVLTRNDQAVAPLTSTLRPMAFSDATGASRSIHAGDVRFPPSAFTPGAAVAVRLLADPDPPLVYTFEDAQLRALR